MVINPWTGLSATLDNRFSEDELRNPCFRLGVDPANLPGRTKREKASELVLYLYRRRAIHKLVGVGREQRPDIIWDDLIQEGLVQLYDQVQEVSRAKRWQEVRQLYIPRSVWALGSLAVLALVAVTIVLKNNAKPIPTPTTTTQRVPAQATSDALPALTIESHRDGDPVDQTEVISGTYRNLGSGWRLWSLVQSGGYWWINDHFPLEQSQGEWQLKAIFGYVGTRSIGATFKVLILAVERGSDAGKYLESAGGRIEELPLMAKIDEAIDDHGGWSVG